MKNLFLYIIGAILDDSSKITVDEEEADGFITIKATVPPELMGKLIGKGGKTINSIKNILKIKAIKEKKRVEIELVEQQ